MLLYTELCTWFLQPRSIPFTSDRQHKANLGGSGERNKNVFFCVCAKKQKLVINSINVENLLYYVPAILVKAATPGKEERLP